MSASMTCMPSRPNASAIAKPMPLAPPVTKAVLPRKSFITPPFRASGNSSRCAASLGRLRGGAGRRPSAELQPLQIALLAPLGHQRVEGVDPRRVSAPAEAARAGLTEVALVVVVAGG